MTAESELRQRRVSAKPDHYTVSPSVSDTTAQHAYSPATALWLESRRQQDGSFRPHGENRPFTFQNVRIARRLIHLAGPRFLLLFLKGQEWRVGAFLAWTLVKGLIPATKIWASSRMLDVVQASFDAKGVDKEEVLRVALISAILPFGEDLLATLADDNREVVRSHVDHILERAYLATQLSLSIPALSSPYITSLVYEAGVFAGHEPKLRDGVSRQYGGPFDCMASTFSLLNTLVLVTSKVYLLMRTLSAGTSINFSSILLIFLAIAPSFLRIIGDLFRPRQTFAIRFYGMRSRQAVRDIKSMANRGPHKQEIILFGLKDWVLAKWDKLSSLTNDEKLGQRRDGKAFEIGLKLVEDNVQTSFYVLLALRILPTNLSLGSIRLYQQITQSLLNSLRSISVTCSSTFQTIFLLAAFTEAIDLPNHPEVLQPSAYRHTELLDYDDHRVEGGMGLTVSDLSFRYPGTDKDVLRNINLTIKPGATLAIVGFNGGGKTTLVKALMGLYDHRGTFLLNGRPIESFDPTTVHRRTSCLFQDFCKYSFTLRENVGMGNVTHVDDIECIQQAIERGGAEKVLEKVGLEGQLNRHGIPDPTGAGGDIQFENKEAERLKRIHGQKQGSGLAGIVPKILRKGGVKAQPDTPTELVSFPGTPPKSADPAAPSSIRPTSVSNTVSDAEATKASLSGGQWQRVALSRAFMRAGEADLVVFDEPSASLDPRAEAQLFDRIHALSHQNGRRCTTIYISHRFSTVKRADQIAVVEDGTIVECGPHAELMTRNGRYAEFYNLQKAGFRD